MRLSALTAESAWSYAIWPPNPETGERARAEQVQVISDPDSVDAFFARQAAN